MLIYHDIYLDVEPKRNMLLEAEGKLNDANKKLAAVNENVAALEARKQELQNQLMQATEEKNTLVEKAEQTAKRLNLAERLVNGLKDEGVRWAQNVDNLDAEREQLVGNMMVSSPFIAYIGPFNSVFRTQMWEQTWVPDLRGRGIRAPTSSTRSRCSPTRPRRPTGRRRGCRRTGSRSRTRRSSRGARATR